MYGAIDRFRRHLEHYLSAFRLGRRDRGRRGTASTLRPFSDAVEHAAASIPDARVRDLSGAGHFAPNLNPEPVADELVRFFEGTLNTS
jgi:pimeloyl-ACP methyl ester carboxylesterase